MRYWASMVAVFLCGVVSAGTVAAPGDPAPAGAAPLVSANVNVTVDDFTNRFTLAARNADLSAVLLALAKASGWDMRLENVASRPVSVAVENEPIENVVAAVARAANCAPALVFVVTPRKEGQSLPDPFKLPLGLPQVSLQLVAPVAASEVVKLLGQQARSEVEVSPEVKGQARIEVRNVPIQEALDAACKQVDAVWTLSYRLRPIPVLAQPTPGRRNPRLPGGGTGTTPGGRPGGPATMPGGRPGGTTPGGGGRPTPGATPAAPGAQSVPAFPDPPAWAKLSPEEKVQAAFRELRRANRRAQKN